MLPCTLQRGYCGLLLDSQILPNLQVGFELHSHVEPTTELNTEALPSEPRSWSVQSLNLLHLIVSSTIARKELCLRFLGR